MKPKVIISVDVEAQPGRSAVDPLDRLIWGRFPAGEFGIQRMMSMAEAAGVSLTMFLDYAEVAIYGDALLDVGREIHRRGHDLQLHLHQSFLPEEFYASRGLSAVPDLNLASPAASDSLLDFLLEQHTKVAPAPTAFRGGGYRFTERLLERFGEIGIVDMSCNPSRASQPVRIAPRAQFEWAIGDKSTLEIPVSCVHGFLGLPRDFDYNINNGALLKHVLEICIERHREFLRSFHARFGADAVCVLVMHSWSFLQLDDEKQFFVEPNLKIVEVFEGLLDVLRQDYAVISASEAARLFGSGRLPARDRLPFAHEPPAGAVLSDLRSAAGG